MKQGDGGFAPSYNAQISTDAAHGLIVGAGLTQCGSDYGELVGAMERVEQSTGQTPKQVVTDGGFTSRENVVALDGKGIEMIGSLAEHNEQSAGQLQRRGVAEAFYPKAFVYDEKQDVYRCPAGAVLRHDGQERAAGIVHHLYLRAWVNRLSAVMFLPDPTLASLEKAAAGGIRRLCGGGAGGSESPLPRSTGAPDCGSNEGIAAR
jgi:hypothetical protein